MLGCASDLSVDQDMTYDDTRWTGIRKDRRRPHGHSPACRQIHYASFPSAVHVNLGTRVDDEVQLGGSSSSRAALDEIAEPRIRRFDRAGGAGGPRLGAVPCEDEHPRSAGNTNRNNDVDDCGVLMLALMPVSTDDRRHRRLTNTSVLVGRRRAAAGGDDPVPFCFAFSSR